VHRAQIRRGDYGFLREAILWLLTAAKTEGLPQGIVDELDFCASELLANIAGYAFDDDDVHEVVLGLTNTPDRVALAIEDDGVPFDPVRGDTYVEPETLDAAGHRGYGVHLVRRFADEMQYRREDGRNIVTVVKFLPS
jgi:anti-sigma regulatory factor (Ser/Thr protein kinase)